MSDPSTTNFGKVCVEKGYVTEAELQEAVDVKGKMAEMGMDERLGVILVRKGFMTESQVKDVLKSQGSRSNVKLAGYEIIEKVGQGAMGAVFRARQISLDRIVALKILPPALAKDEVFIERFTKEARAAGRLNHPNIVQGIDVGSDSGYHYFAMEFVEGETLKDKFSREGVVSEKLALDVCGDVGKGLQHAFEHGLVHGDIKPDNIMLTDKGQSKVCDLGLARPTASGDDSGKRSKTVMGTPHYMSPEQARGQLDIDIRSDIYSLGASIYHIVTGRTPFQGASSREVMTKHLTEDLVSPIDLNPDLSDDLELVIEKMMAKNRDDRYQTPEELIEDVERVRAHRRPKASRLAEGKSKILRAARRRSGGGGRESVRRDHDSEPAATNMMPLMLGAAFVVVGGIIGFFLMSRGGDTNRRKMPRPHTAARTTKTPKTPRPPPDANTAGRVQKAKTKMDDALLFAAQNPGLFNQIDQKLKAVLPSAKGTDVFAMVRSAINDNRARQTQARDAKIVDAAEKAQPLMAEWKFEAAKALFDAKEYAELLSGSSSSLLKDEIRKIKSRAQTAWRELKERADIYKSINRPVRPLIEPIVAGTDSPWIQVAADKLLVDIVAAEAKTQQVAASQAKVAAFDTYQAALTKVVDAINAKDMTRAAAEADKAIADAALKDYHKNFERIRRDIQTDQDREKGVAVALKALIGKKDPPIHPNGNRVKGKIVSVKPDDGESGSFEFAPNYGRGTTGTIVRKYPISALTVDDRIELLGLSTTSPEGQYATAVKYLFGGEFDKARLLFLRVQGRPQFKEDATFYLETWTEVAAAKLLAQARAEFKKENWAQAKVLLGQLTEKYRDTEVYRLNSSRGGRPPAP